MLMNTEMISIYFCHFLKKFVEGGKKFKLLLYLIAYTLEGFFTTAKNFYQIL